MKKILFPALVALGALAANAGTMTLTTDMAVGSKVRILLNSTSATNTISIDWGNGVEAKYNIDPNEMAYNRWIDGSIEGTTLKISGNVTEASLQELDLTSAYLENMSVLTSLDLSHNKIKDFEISGLTPLKSLNLSYNNVTNTVETATLTLENAGETLTDFSIYHNPGLTCLNISSLTNLVYFSANDCPDLASVFICLPEDSRPNLRSINLSNCDLTHFYPVNLPSLTTLQLNNNKLMTTIYDTDPFVLGDYPSLTTLNVSDNRGVESLDITGCKKLESLGISNCSFKTIDVSQCPELYSLSAANNNLSSLDLGNNPAMKTINIAGNPIKEIDLSKFSNLSTVDISNTQIGRVDILKTYFLKEFIAQNTNLEFVDFNGMLQMRRIDLRDNKNFTPESMTYTLRTLPECSAEGGAASPNLLISGSNGETSYTAIATDLDHHWTIDVVGTGTAQNTQTTVTLVGATDTGENKAGNSGRIYGGGNAYDFNYDLDVYETAGGKFILAQWQPVWFQKMESVIDKAYVGVPMYVYAYPEEGKKFKSVTVNGTDIASPWFIISEPSTIKVNFTNEENSIAFTTTPGQTLSMLVNTVNTNGTVWIDWGTGTRTAYTGQTAYNPNYAEIGGTRIDGSAAGSTITIYGEIAALDLSGYGDVAADFGLWDNAITSIDLTNADNLQYLNLYWNPLESIDLSGAPNLLVLDVSYTNLKELDLSGATGLKWLDAYSDGWGEDGISMLKSIDVTGLPLLQHLDVHSNELTSLDLSKNPYLWYLKASGNELTSIDLSKNPALETVELQNNKLTTIDVSNLKELLTLSVSGNELTSLDVKNNTLLDALSFDNNHIKAIDLSKNANLRTVYLNGNGMNADELNDVYYLLPQRKTFAEEENATISGTNLFVIQGLDREENEGTRADSSIAIDRGWKPSHTGTNGGSDYAYLDIKTPTHGTVAVKDAEGKEYTHGTKVPKYSLLTLEATPDEGYALASFSLNGEEPQGGNQFEMPGIYTKLSVTFAKAGGISDAVSGVKVYTNGSVLSVVADEATVDIYGVDGIQAVRSAAVSGSADFTLASGVYVVRVSSAAGVHTEKVTVK